MAFTGATSARLPRKLLPAVFCACLGLAPAASAAQDSVVDIMRAPATEAAGPEIGGTCQTNNVRYATQTSATVTSSTAFQSMISTKFTIAGSRPHCVIVVVSGETGAVSPSGMNVRARIPGYGIAEPPVARMARPTTIGAFETSSMQFVFKRVPPGTWRVRIQYQSSAGDAVAAQKRALTVHY